MLEGAVELTLVGLDVSGVEAEVAAVQLLARSLDQDPGDTDLWREFRLALKALREASHGGNPGEGIDELLARLGGAALPDRT